MTRTAARAFAAVTFGALTTVAALWALTAIAPLRAVSPAGRAQVQALQLDLLFDQLFDFCDQLVVVAAARQAHRQA